jgi:uncharacterized protein YggE
MLPRLMILAGLVGLGALASAQMMCPPPPRTISVTTTTQRMVAPDLAFAVVAVETQANTVAAATAANNTAATKVIAAIRGLNIPNLTVRTLAFDVQPVYEQLPPQGQPRTPRIVGYRVVNRVQARIPDTDADRLATNVGRVLDAALAAGANRVDQVSFDLQDEQRALREVLADAARGARETATVLATASGVVLGPLQSLSTSPAYQPYFAQARAADLAATPGVPIVAGMLTISATVTASYLIQ